MKHYEATHMYSKLFFLAAVFLKIFAHHCDDSSVQSEKRCSKI